MIQDKFSQELYGLDLKLEFSQPEFHPITSSRYFSLSQQKTATRSNGMKFRLEFSCPRKKTQDTPLLPMGKGEINMYVTWSYKKCRIRTNNVSTQSFFRPFLPHTFSTGPKVNSSGEFSIDQALIKCCNIYITASTKLDSKLRQRKNS